MVAGLAADVFVAGDPRQGVGGDIAVAEDGSRVYFQSPNRLLPGAPLLSNGSSTYRVTLGGALRWIGGPGLPPGETGLSAISPSGATGIFVSKAPSVNPLGGLSDNGGTSQYYRYDDEASSLICVSCPLDGSVPRGDLPTPGSSRASGANTSGLSENGDTVAFVTPTALVNADQNTAGPGQETTVGNDVYEWRDGRPLLISDGLTDWPNRGPELDGISPSGRDVFFDASAQYTPDALDAYNRLYDARIGGGFEFPVPPKPCPLEVCQGTPKGAPEEAAPGTGSFAGPSTANNRKHATKAKQKKKHKKRKHKKHQHRANHKGRASR